jgi:hypothetical protein
MKGALLADTKRGPSFTVTVKVKEDSYKDMGSVMYIVMVYVPASASSSENVVNVPSWFRMKGPVAALPLLSSTSIE